MLSFITCNDLERQIENTTLYLGAQGKPFEIISDSCKRTYGRRWQK